MKKPIIKWVFISVASVVALILLVVYFPFLSDYFFKNNTTQGELLKVALTAVAGFVAILVWHSSFRRAKATEQQVAATVKSNVDTRFNNAVGHLGSENPTVVLGGIHALQKLATGNEPYQQIVHNVFCSYLRENSAKHYEKVDFEKTPNKCPVIIQTLIDYLFKPYNNKENIYKNFRSNLSFSTLINCDFRDIKIDNVDFSNCVLEKCKFHNGILNNCSFRDGTLKQCAFKSSAMNICRFDGGTLTECYFQKGILTMCNFTNGILADCNFSDGTLNNCILYAELINTELPPNKITEK